MLRAVVESPALHVVVQLFGFPREDIGDPIGDVGPANPVPVEGQGLGG